MGVFDFVRSGLREMMVARPDDQKHRIVYKHPDQKIPAFAQLTVDSDECAVFFRDGRVVGVLPPGRVTLQTQNVPFLNALFTNYTGKDVFIAEVFFVKTAPVRSVPFGGPVGDMIDPLTGEQVTPRIFGEMSIVVVDPVKFVIGYSGQATTGDNEEILGWIKGLFLNGVKTALGELCENEGKSLLQTVSLTARLSEQFVARSPSLSDIGARVLQVGQFNINFNDDDRKRLVAANAEIAKAERQAKVKRIGVEGARADADARQVGLDQQFNQDARYVRELAGSYQGYAAGQAVIGAGQGMAAHGVGSGIAGLGAQVAVGMGMGNAMAAGMASPAAPAGGPSLTCTKCGATQAGGKFCADCGGPLMGAKRFCSGCGTELAPGGKFCPNCGTAAAAATAGAR
ncbi:MAG TPA: SPFH domain-containing protein [Polyangiaceae bacterium]|jgi:membrane protease subunit (stomatin/prohibitin family)|nr:SPFH domain-containing protein [Polyangiaceae bacterium]